MNFHFAEYEFHHPVWFVLAVLTATGVGTWWFLKSRHWI